MSDKKQQLTLLVPAAARAAHSELLDALGTENRPAQWMDFMDAVTRLLPEVLSSGRPTAEAIRRCAIGQLGFASWAAMIEAPTSAGGLGWSFSAWKAWRRAWTTVKSHPWLRDEAMTSSEINTLSQQVKKTGSEFPASAEALEDWKNAQEASREAERLESVKVLKKNLDAALAALQKAETALSISTESVKKLRQERDDALLKIEKQAETIGTLKNQKSAAEKNRDEWHKKATTPPPAKPRLSRWQLFLNWIFGRS